jgi:hypothetical protein
MRARRPGILFCVAGLLAWASAAAGSAPRAPLPDAPLETITLAPQERAAVLGGRIVVRELPATAEPVRTFEAVGLLPGSLDEAFAVIAGFRRYAEFMPSVKRTLVREESGNVSVVEIGIGLPFGQSRRYRLRYEWRRTEAGFVLTWRKVPWPELEPGQTVADTGGRWLVRRLEGGGLVASYLFFTDPRPVPLGLSGFAQAFGRKSGPDVIRAVERRILALFPRGSGERPGSQNSLP